MSHWVSETCGGEVCRVCRKPATHKLGEEIPSDATGDFFKVIAGEEKAPEFYQYAARHNLTAYVCCEHFSEVLGPMARLQCYGRKLP